MLEWLRKHQKKVNFFGGLLILLLTTFFYFWTTSKAVSEGKETSKKRFERSYHSSNTIVRPNKQKPDMSRFSEKLKNSKQGEILLLIFMLVGGGMFIYSLFSKEEEKK